MGPAPTCGSYPLPLHVLGPVASPSGQAARLAPGAKYVLLTCSTWFAARACFPPPRFGLLPTSPLYLPPPGSACSLHLPYISPISPTPRFGLLPTSPLHLPYISRAQVRPARSLARRHRVRLPLPRRAAARLRPSAAQRAHELTRGHEGSTAPARVTSAWPLPGLSLVHSRSCASVARRGAGPS